MTNPAEDSIRIARSYMDSLTVESRVVGAGKASTEVDLLGAHFSTPIMTAPLSHIDLPAMARGALAAGACCSIGMGSIGELGRVLETGAKVVKIIKPYADRGEIFARIRYAETHGALAVGMDVEHAFNTRDAEDSLVLGCQMALPTLEELKEYIDSTKLPFFIKGALSVRDALRCAELGCTGISLSHHNSIMPCAVPPVRLLPHIRKAVGDKLLIIVDGGIESGFDAFKALALGADMVAVGKPVMNALKEKGAEGAQKVLETMSAELRSLLRRTDSPDPRHIDPSVIWTPDRL